MQTTDVMVNKSHHAACMGLNQRPGRPIKGYQPNPGLISMFRRTGTERRNPKTLLQSTAPPSNQQVSKRHSYAEAWRSGMEGNGQYGNGAGSRVRGNGNSGFRGQSQGEAFARAGYQRP
jgi:hypothetical protein